MMRHLLLVVFCLLTGVSGVCAEDTASRLRAGTAKVNITPPSPRYPVHDSLYARALMLECGETRIAFVALDLISYDNIPLATRLKEEFDLQELFFCSQHTHSAETAPEAWLGGQIRKALSSASDMMFEARVSAGHRTFPQLSFNRLIIRDNGRGLESWVGDEHYTAVNPERIPHGPVDNSVGVIKVEDMQGNPKVIMMNYACHPDVAWNNFEISADYVGYATKYVEEAFDNKVNCLFVQGGGGNQAPLFKDGGRTGPDDPRSCNYELIDRMGKLLSFEAVRLAKEIYPHPYDKADLRVRTDSLTFTGRYDKSLIYDVHFSVVSVNGRIAIATVPGEPFIKFQLDWKREMQPNDVIPFFFGYTWNDGKWPIYIPDIRSAAYGGYGADNGPDLIEVGAGEKIFIKLIENYYRLMGVYR